MMEIKLENISYEIRFNTRCEISHQWHPLKLGKLHGILNVDLCTNCV